MIIYAKSTKTAPNLQGQLLLTPFASSFPTNSGSA